MSRKKFLAVLTVIVSLVTGVKSSYGLEAKEVKDALGMSVYLQGGYTANFTNDGKTTDLRPFDTNSDQFTFDLAQISFSKEAKEADSIGYRFKISTGETANYIHSTGTTADEFDLTEGFIEYNFGGNVKASIGKFATFIGGEVIEAIDNPNYSRSFLFYYAIPFTHTGLRISRGFSDKFSLSLFVVNGWDNFSDDNKDKSIGLSASITPSDKLSVLINGITGRELTNQRSVLDTVITINATEKMTISLNADYGMEEKASIVNPGEDAKWYGVAAILKQKFSEKYSLAIRGEIFNDKDGYRTGTKQNLKEITVTPEITLKGGVVVRPELRYDKSDEKVFDGGNKDYQFTLALGLMYRF